MHNLPLLGTFGMVALMAGPLASLPIHVGAWVLERTYEAFSSRTNSQG